MAFADLMEQVPEPGARQRLRGYLTAVESGLPGSARARSDILTEVCDGLLETYQAYRDRGEAPAVAAQSAVTEFGDARTLARQFAGTLASRAAYRIGIGLVLSGPVVGATWVVTFAERTGAGWWRQAPEMTNAVPVLRLALLVAVPAALLAAVGAGQALARRLASTSRFLPLTTAFPLLPPRVTATAALVATTACVAADTGMLLSLVGSVIGGAAWPPVALLAGVASLVRLTVAAACARRVVVLRDAVG